MKRLLIFAAIACMFSACSEEAVVLEQKIPISISVGQQTRANDTEFVVGDEVGLYVVNYTSNIAGSLVVIGNQVDNMRFTYNGNLWTPDEAIYWKDKNTSADFFVYYPYDSNLSTVAAYPFSVKTDQSAEADFWASDFLWGKVSNVAPTVSSVPITVNHVLSRVIINIKPGEGFTEEVWATAVKSVQINDIKISSTVDLSTGGVTALEEFSNIVPMMVEEDSYEAMVIPQTIADNSKFIVVTVDGVNYVYRKGYTFNPNTQHKFTITVNKSGSSIDVAIGEWAIDGTNNDGIAE